MESLNNLIYKISKHTGLYIQDCGTSLVKNIMLKTLVLKQTFTVKNIDKIIKTMRFSCDSGYFYYQDIHIIFGTRFFYFTNCRVVAKYLIKIKRILLKGDLNDLIYKLSKSLDIEIITSTENVVIKNIMFKTLLLKQAISLDKSLIDNFLHVSQFTYYIHIWGSIIYALKPTKQVIPAIKLLTKLKDMTQ